LGFFVSSVIIKYLSIKLFYFSAKEIGNTEFGGWRPNQRLGKIVALKNKQRFFFKREN